MQHNDANPKYMDNLTPRQLRIFNQFVESPEKTYSVADFASFGLNRTTIFRDVKKLVHAGLLEPEGKAYRINKNSDAWLRWELSQAPWLRPAVTYNPELLNNYQPNNTFLLTKSQLEMLESTGYVKGVAQAKKKEKAYERILSSLLIDLTHASSNLENVNISWLDTKTLIELGERPKGLTEQQLRIVLNHKEAITFLKDHGAKLRLSKRDLFDIHSLVIDGLLADDTAIGALRSVAVRFEDSRYIPPDNPHQLREIFEQFCNKANAITHPFEQAFFVMVFLPYIQPFQDGNKRTSRLAMNVPLIRHALAPFSFSDIKGRDYMFGLIAFYERGRHHFLAEAFTDAYQKSAARYHDLIAYVNDGGTLGTISG